MAQWRSSAAMVVPPPFALTEAQRRTTTLAPGLGSELSVFRTINKLMNWLSKLPFSLNDPSKGVELVNVMHRQTWREVHMPYAEENVLVELRRSLQHSFHYPTTSAVEVNSTTFSLYTASHWTPLIQILPQQQPRPQLVWPVRTHKLTKLYRNPSLWRVLSPRVSTSGLLRLENYA